MNVERFRAVVGVPEVLAIIDMSVVLVDMHFEKGVGGFYCFESICCERNGQPMRRYALPIVHYGTVNPRDITDYGPPFEVEYLLLSEGDYKDKVLMKHKLQGDLTQFDIVITCTDAHYQKLNMDVGRPALWRTNPDWMREILDKKTKYDKTIERAIARPLDEATYLNILNRAAGDSKASPARQASPPPAARAPAQARPAATAVTKPPPQNMNATPREIPAGGVELDSLLKGPETDLGTGSVDGILG